MSAMQSIAAHPLVWKTGWMLAHSLWQMLAVALSLAVVLGFMRQASANLRYLICCSALGLAVTLPLGTAFILTGGQRHEFRPVALAANETGPMIPALPVVVEKQHIQAGAAGVIDDVPKGASLRELRTKMESGLPYAVMLWLAGVFGLGFWNLGGWVQLQRVKRQMVTGVTDDIRERVGGLAKRLRIRQAVAVAQSALIEIPSVVGWLKPVILLPASALSGLDPSQLEALLAHELAHIRRHDYIVNILQTAIEILGFYHPAIWWMSRRIRMERENCCDDVAAELVGSRRLYVDALATMEELRGRSDLVMAANGGNLLARIRRLAGDQRESGGNHRWMAAILSIVLAVTVFVIGGAQAMSAHATGAETQPGDELIENALTDSEILTDTGLSSEAAEFLAAMELSDPDVIRHVRMLLRDPARVTADQAWQNVRALMLDTGDEGQRAAGDLLAGDSHLVRLFTIGLIPEAGDSTELLLGSAITCWDNLRPKEKETFQDVLPKVLAAHPGDAVIADHVEEIVIRMIAESGRLAPMAGMRLAKQLNLDSDDIVAAIKLQTGNEIFDHFANVHPVRKMAMEMLGEQYVSPLPELPVDYARISVAGERGLMPATNLQVGVLASLYTATGPCAGGDDNYGWRHHCILLEKLSQSGVNVTPLLHPITKLEMTPLEGKLRRLGLPDMVLNAANVRDLSQCDVVTLTRVYNLKPEVVDALEEYVWNGGGIVTLDGSGIMSCSAADKFAWLMDRPTLACEGNWISNQKLIEHRDNPLTRGLDLDLPAEQPDHIFNTNGYRFEEPMYEDQILLRFEPGGAVALRVATYGKGRIANIGWLLETGESPTGDRNAELLRRVLAWAGGRENKDFLPAPVYARTRFNN